MKKLKSSLKLSTISKSHSDTSIPKNVRFAPQLTTIKRFDYRDEPIIISTENSPLGSPRLHDDDDDNTRSAGSRRRGNEYSFDLENDIELETEKFWFNNRSLLPDLLKNEKMFNYYNDLNDFHLDDFYNSDIGTDPDDLLDDDDVYDDDYDDDELDGRRSSDYKFIRPHHRRSLLLDVMENDDGHNMVNNAHNHHSLIDNNHGNHFTYHSPTDDLLHSSGAHGESLSLYVNPRSFDSINWNIKSSNVVPFQNNCYVSKESLESSLFQFLQGQNIRLHSLDQDPKDSYKIVGLIYVNNLNFEKFSEVKFTFNHWKDMHYVSAVYNKSITSNIDEFKFIIDLNSLKFFLQVKNLLSSKVDQNNLSIELCCRYDVNNETYYDNNNYQNYHISLIATFQNASIDQTPKISNKENITPNKDFFYSSLSVEPNQPRSLTNFNNTTFIPNTPSISTTSSQRTFSDNTDYYNTSPLKHLYHNDTTPFVKRPARSNEVIENIDNLIDNKMITYYNKNSGLNTGMSTSFDNQAGSSLPVSQSSTLNSSSHNSNDTLLSDTSSSSSFNSLQYPLKSTSTSYTNTESFTLPSSSATSTVSPSTDPHITNNFDYSDLYEPNDTLLTDANLYNYSFNSVNLKNPNNNPLNDNDNEDSCFNYSSPFLSTYNNNGNTPVNDGTIIGGIIPENYNDQSRDNSADLNFFDDSQSIGTNTTIDDTNNNIYSQTLNDTNTSRIFIHDKNNNSTDTLLGFSVPLEPPNISKESSLNLTNSRDNLTIFTEPTSNSNSNLNSIPNSATISNTASITKSKTNSNTIILNLDPEHEQKQKMKQNLNLNIPHNDTNTNTITDKALSTVSYHPIPDFDTERSKLSVKKSGLKDLTYQAFLESYCFYNPKQEQSTTEEQERQQEEENDFEEHNKMQNEFINTPIALAGSLDNINSDHNNDNNTDTNTNNSNIQSYSSTDTSLHSNSFLSTTPPILSQGHDRWL
ncbi:protein phosphatase regulator GAC1 NDAI_0D02740 [Naumovozyma dairenensis CBS 421]|uniref:CBM21 domain-containing protein n=1 Tax=Naumovozyma dairenensis (strain ATCC 10597 / BCRC 20456 / CBS 421 / NBRC 0211 / NRRL Y-12639) TaxID=1071378 RepID=G0W9X7_NAUDC|nr:hypothetical protein NDAI_0D02740 [Naumovozyma dairenensis CBS 421]CCD24588.1 hypothetical protein NDAI_0D02740 [Naumovozyma dairenensis CBS 421]